MELTLASRVDVGPDVPDWDWTGWLDTTPADAMPADAMPADVLVTAGFDAARERAALARADADGTTLLSIRVSSDEVVIGPFRAGSQSACAGCAQARQHHRYAGTPGRPVPAPQVSGPTRSGYPLLVETIVEAVLCGGVFEDGDTVVVSASGAVHRHRVRRSQHCLICAPPVPTLDPEVPPPAAALTPRPAGSPLATRGTTPPLDLDLDRLRAAALDPRFGPATRTRRNGLMSFALSQVMMLGDSPPGQGRGSTFREAEVIGYLEGFERSAGFPHTTQLLRAVSRRELGSTALDPACLGTYTDQQYDSPLSRVRRYDDDTPMDWAWARPLGDLGGADSASVLVPADIAFYSHHYPQLVTPTSKARNFFLESSSGSALGGSFEEASLHSLFELAERDAFLLSWHGTAPLPEITHRSITDPESRFLIGRIAASGYDLHLLRATQDIDLPVVWALAVTADRSRPASFSAAGSNPDPVLAVRAALWELAQCVLAGATAHPGDAAHADELAADPWLVDELHDHIARYASPDLLPRVTRALGGPQVELGEAFPGWPDVFVRAADHDVTQALRYVLKLYRAAGLSTVLTVDQSSREHRDLGCSVVRCIVPGIVAMCFGQAQQRLTDLPRLAALAGPAPYDPHPFP